MTDENKAVNEVLLESMNYMSSEVSCRNCCHFVDTDCSGNVGALPLHCSLNPAIKLFGIQPEGRCDHFKSESKKIKHDFDPT